MFFIIWFILGLVGAIIATTKTKCDICMFLIWTLMGLFGLVLAIIAPKEQNITQ